MPSIHSAHLLKALFTCLLFTAPIVSSSAQTAGLLQSGDVVALCGDSITFQKIYSVYVEDYLVMCQPQSALQAMQFGVGGETAQRFALRQKGSVLPFKPTVATLFYGMNDGSYQPSDLTRQATYRKSLTEAVQTFKSNGVRFIIVGSPGVVDTDSFKRIDAAAYNKTLGDLAQIAKEVATEQQVSFADVHPVMENTMIQAKAKWGEKYHVAGDDGIHPGANGHLIIAYAFLKALGCSGDIGTITLDMRAGTAQATDGHKVLSCGNGLIEVESSRYPFCFYGDPTKTDSTRGMLEFIPFNQDLNRFLLVVVNPSAVNFKVTWGKQSKTFAAADLQKGINLAAEFLDNPFNEPFAKVEAAIKQQQSFEGGGLQNILHSISEWSSTYPEQQAIFIQFKDSTLKMSEDYRKRPAELVIPVKHVIKIEPAS